MRRLILLSLSFLLALLSAITFIRGASQASPTLPTETSSATPNTVQLSHIHPALLTAMAQAAPGDQIGIIVQWRRDPAFASRAALGSTKLQQRAALVAALQDGAKQQSGALQSAILQAEMQGTASRMQAFWISPVIALRATPDFIQSLALRQDVEQVRLDEKFYLEKDDFRLDETSAAPNSEQPNLTMINAILAQQALGLDGKGVVVANLDTGVDWQHPALIKQYRGYNPHGPAVHSGNWYVVTGEPYSYPGDGIGHGTHTMGTMVGDDGQGNRTGVAPGARWIAVKLFANDGSTYESWIHAAFQWILAPNGDPALAPDIVNNSWGSNSSTNENLRPDVIALRAGGILPIFSAGNSGPAARSVNSPASYPEAFAVGAVDYDKSVASFSSRGPSPWEEIKPQVSAPGVNVRSTFPGGGYAFSSGTSMAAPHVAGLAALLLSAHPGMSPSELETILVNTAQPLGSEVPNNDTGWGLINAYAAGLKVTNNGEIVGSIQAVGGAPIPYPTISASSRDGSQNITITADSAGEFRLALLPGLYDLTASAFGFIPQKQYAVNVTYGQQSSVNFSLTAQPIGSIFGRVSDLNSGAGLSATLTVLNSPIQVQTNPASGDYSLALPPGTWQIRVAADAHRIGHITPTVSAGNGYLFNISLTPSPRILLVDSGQWYYGSQIGYFQDALDSLDYNYTLWTIRSIDGSGLPDTRPTSNTLAAYDVVIWSSPSDSPGLVGSASDLDYYMKHHGKLLVSGQDIAFLDAGGYLFAGFFPYMTSDLSVGFNTEGNLADLLGAPGSPLDGLQVTLNTPDSARQQNSPDAIKIRNPLISNPALTWPDATIGGVTAGICQPYRAAWLGFGLEGAGPRPVRTELMGRLLDWLETPPQAYGLLITPPKGTFIGQPGSTITQTVVVNNRGVQTDTYDLTLGGGTWPITLTLPGGSQIDPKTSLTITGCQNTVITATIHIPADLPRQTLNTYTLTLTSRSDPLVSASAAFRAKTPASILVVDAERFYNYIDRYQKALDDLSLSYDVYNGYNNAGLPSTATLTSYPTILWVTGYDWARPVNDAIESRLENFLSKGGSLLVSSQDWLDVAGLDKFTRTYLGISGATLEVTSTEVAAPSGSLLGDDLGPWRLTYPFLNDSDGLVPTQEAATVLRDQNLFNTGILHKGVYSPTSSTWRTAFFSFPLEALDAPARQTLLERSLFWLSPFGGSRLQTPPSAVAGGQFPVTLTLALAGNQPLNNLKASLPLPSGTSLVSGSLNGPWTYDAASKSLMWEGSLNPGISLTLSASIDLSASLPAGTLLPFEARVSTGDGLQAVAKSTTLVDAAWFSLQAQASTLQAELNHTIDYTTTVINLGTAAGSAALTETIRSGLALIPGSASANSGFITMQDPSHFLWVGSVIPGQKVLINFTCRVNLTEPGARLATRVDLSGPYNRRLAWTMVTVTARMYLPVIGR
jgi:uncharacterized repeat protein (TIGR01451 family)